MKRRALGNTGLVVSELGFGCSPLGGVFGTVDEREAEAAVHLALDLGITFFDVAPFYGDTLAETVLGRALRGVARDRYVLCTKVGRYGGGRFDYSAANVRAGVVASMARLKVDHLDILLCHDIEFAKVDQIVGETLPAMRALQREGLVRAVGASGLPLAALSEVLSHAELDVVLSYCHANLYDTTAAAFDPGGAALVLASPLAMGLLSDAGPPAWHPAPAALLAACAETAAWCRARAIDLARVALQIAVGQVSSAPTIVGMSTRAEVERNVAAIKDPVDEALVAELRAQLDAVRDLTWPSGRWSAAGRPYSR